jgi:hypothetical protein
MAGGLAASSFGAAGRCSSDCAAEKQPRASPAGIRKKQEWRRGERYINEAPAWLDFTGETESEAIREPEHVLNS